MNWKLD